MSRRPTAAAVTLAMALLFISPGSTNAFELHRIFCCRCPSSPDAAVANLQQTARWYPQYTIYENYGGGVPTYAYGYFGAKGHSTYGCHRGYYGDLYQWSPMH